MLDTITSIMREYVVYEDEKIRLFCNNNKSLIQFENTHTCFLDGIRVQESSNSYIYGAIEWLMVTPSKELANNLKQC